MLKDVVCVGSWGRFANGPWVVVLLISEGRCRLSRFQSNTWNFCLFFQIPFIWGNEGFKPRFHFWIGLLEQVASLKQRTPRVESNSELQETVHILKFAFCHHGNYHAQSFHEAASCPLKKQLYIFFPPPHQNFALECQCFNGQMPFNFHPKAINGNSIAISSFASDFFQSE